MEDFAEINRRNIEEFRANEGRLRGFEGYPMLLLTATGAKSGKRYTTPLMYLPDGDRIVVFASKGGAPTNPDWYHNLVARPLVTLEVGTETFEARAEVAQGVERNTLYERQVQAFPMFGDYQQKTSRQIPVVVLTRVS